MCIEEGVQVETAIYKPDSLAPRIKEAGVKWIHKTARVKDALHAEELGADAVIVVGLEGVGFKNPVQLPTLITTTWGAKQFKVPFIAAGGIGDARGFLGALGMGAAGIMMGTAFMATKECPVNEVSKEAIVRSRPDNPQLRYRVLTSSKPDEYEKVMKLRDKLPLEKWLPMLERIQPRHSEWDAAGEQVESAGEQSRVGSLAVGAINNIPTVKEFIDGIIHEAMEILDSWQFLKVK